MSLLTWSEHAPSRNDHFFLSFFLSFLKLFWALFSGWESNDHFWMIYDSIYALDSGNGTATTCHPSRDLTGANGSGHHHRWHSMDSGGQSAGHCDMRTETLRGTRWRGSWREIYGLFFFFRTGRERDGLALAVDCWLICRLLKAIHVWWEKEYRSPSLFYFFQCNNGGPPSLSFSLVFYFSDSFPTILAHAWFTTVIIR